MSKGKYSPYLTRKMIADHTSETFIYNAHGAVAPDYDKSEPYCEKKHLGHYDREGFDSYGYSAWLADGSYAGIGEGIDRGGYTEMDYLRMDENEFNDINAYG